MLRKSVLHIAAAALTAAGICVSMSAFASDARRFDIPPGDLAPALESLAKETGLELIFQPVELKGIRTQGVKGTLSPREAVAKLIDGTKLTIRTDAAGAILISTAGLTKTSANGSKTGLELAMAQADAPKASAAVESGASADKQDPEVVVFGQRDVTRNREDTVEPVLVYGSAYFERFEPLTLNDMLKRVPGVYFDKLFNFPQDASTVAFSATGASDNLPRLRNLDSKFSQILVNGRNLASIDFGFGGGQAFLASIPAEAVKEIRVVRSPSADIDSSGVGMTLNIILKDGSKYADSSWRTGGAYFDGEIEPVGSINMRGSTDRYTYSLSATAQDRTGIGHSLNRSISNTRRTSPTAVTMTNSTTFATTLSTQLDRDRSVIGNIGFNVGGYGKLDLEGKYVRTLTDGDADLGGTQHSVVTRQPNVGNPTVTTTNQNLFGPSDSNRDSSNYGAALTYTHDGGAMRWDTVYSYDRTDFKAGSAQLSLDPFTDEPFVSSDSRAAGRGERQQFNNHFAWTPRPKHEIRLGADLQRATDTNDVVSHTDFGGGLGEFDSIFAEDRQKIERADLFAVYEWRPTSAIGLQVGGRSERASYRSDAPPDLIFDEVAAELFQFDPDILSPDTRTRFAATVTGFNPSAHLRWKLSENHELRFSIAQTVRRPNLSELDPKVSVTAGENPFLGNNVTVGNPQLHNEKSIGFDVGYDWRLTNGIVGLNFFSRSIDGLIEQTSIDLERFSRIRPDLSSEIGRLADFVADDLGQELVLIAPLNSDQKTRVRGAELDMSFPLAFISPEAHFYMNATYSRREQDGEPSVESSAFNVAYDHRLAMFGLTYGASVNWITRDRQYTQVINLSITDTRRTLDPNVEIFLEKTLGSSMLARLTVENLTDALDEATTARQLFGTSSGTMDQLRRSESDPRILFTLRGKF